MPLIEVTHSPTLPEAMLYRLGTVLPHLVSEAVECPEEPYDGDLQPGDVELRFRPWGPYDRCGLAVVIEVRSKWTKSRETDRQQRVDTLREAITSATGLDDLGVYLSLPVASWSQDD